MKKALAVAAFLLLAASLTFPISASYHQQQRQDVGQQVSTRVAEIRNEIRQTLEELRTQREQLRQQRQLEIRERQATKRAEIATKVAELRARVIERIKRVFTAILDRMLAALDRLDKIVARINSRIAKLKSGGVDTAAAESALANCTNNEKAAAATAINDSKTKVAAIDLASTNVRNTVLQASSAIRSGKRALQNYHKCLVNVTRTLKAKVPEEATISAR